MTKRRFPRISLLAIAAVPCLYGVLTAYAQTPAQAPAAQAAPPDAARPDPKAEREQELRRTQQSMQENEEARLKLRNEIDRLRGDRAKLNADLIDTSQRVRAADGKIAEAGERLANLQSSERAMRGSLDARKDILVEVLAALQRINRRPPPAVVIQPEDMLEAVRTSILMGAVLPELREEAEALAADLAEIVRLRGAIGEERDNLARERGAAVADRERLEALVSARQAALDTAEGNLEEERQKAGTLARQADTLKDLIARMENESATAKRAADAASRAPQPVQTAAQAAALAGSAFRDPARLAPKIAFADARGVLNLPVSGSITRNYGAPDGFGGQEKGITLTTAPGALVTAPVDGWVAFSGPFRSYRNVLIINVGGGYHVVLIGMDRITVEVGQFVLAGEPLGVMASPTSKSGQASEGSIKPGLYVEFRKDGVPIDPGPWWAKSESEKARG